MLTIHDSREILSNKMPKALHNYIADAGLSLSLTDLKDKKIVKRIVELAIDCESFTLYCFDDAGNVYLAMHKYRFNKDNIHINVYNPNGDNLTYDLDTGMTTMNIPFGVVNKNAKILIMAFVDAMLIE